MKNLGLVLQKVKVLDVSINVVPNVDFNIGNRDDRNLETPTVTVDNFY